jgi:hypothetical protein
MTMWKCVDVAAEKGGPRYSEDRLGKCGSVAWVIDGASAVSEQRVTDHESSDASWLVERLEEALQDLSGETDLTLQQLVAKAIMHTAERAAKDWKAEPEVPPSAALGVIRSDGHRTEYLVLADISVIFRTGESEALEITDQRVDSANTEARSAMTALLDEGLSIEEARRATMPFLARARSQMNKEGGYWVAARDEHAVDHALCGEVEGVSEVILASDGFMRILRPFGLIPDVGVLFTPGHSLGRLAEKVRKAEHDDPETRRFPRWSVSDDLCAQRLRWDR